jgi:phage N-6-adenine-methyltransferase
MAAAISGETMISDKDLEKWGKPGGGNLSALFSSARPDWATPAELAEELGGVFGFSIDAAATAENKKADLFFGPERDALSLDWIAEAEAAGVPPFFWLNPPYGRGIDRWVRRAFEVGACGGLVVVLVPSRTDARWFRYLWAADSLCFIRGRLRFAGAPSSAPFPSVIAVFGRRLSASQRAVLSKYGEIVIPTGSAPGGE